MKRVFQASDFYSAQLIKAYLNDNGIEATVNGELLMGAIGEIPADSYPSVWLLDAEEYDQAKKLISQYEQNLAEMANVNKDVQWLCAECGESIEGQFSQCWKCGGPRVP